MYTAPATIYGILSKILGLKNKLQMITSGVVEIETNVVSGLGVQLPYLCNRAGIHQSFFY